VIFQTQQAQGEHDNSFVKIHTMPKAPSSLLPFEKLQPGAQKVSSWVAWAAVSLQMAVLSSSRPCPVRAEVEIMSCGNERPSSPSFCINTPPTRHQAGFELEVKGVWG